MFVPLTPLEYKRRAVRNFGDKIGVVDGDRRFTYQEFGERADRLAGALRGLDLTPGDRVAFISYNTHHLLEGYYGVLQAGGVLTPINIRLAPQEIAFVLDHCGAAVLCYHRDFQGLVDQVRPNLRSLRHLVIIEGEDPEAHQYEMLLARATPDPGPDIFKVDENAVCELFYTSGTTGPPQGRGPDPPRAGPARPELHHHDAHVRCGSCAAYRAALSRERLGDAAGPHRRGRDAHHAA